MLTYNECVKIAQSTCINMFGKNLSILIKMDLVLLDT